MNIYFVKNISVMPVEFFWFRESRVFRQRVGRRRVGVDRLSYRPVGVDQLAVDKSASASCHVPSKKREEKT